MLSFNLRPFANEELKLIVLNILVFMPMGAFIAYYCGEKRRLFYAFVIGFCLTVAIELIQLFFIGRLADVDDVIANTIGCVSGYFAFLLCCSIPLNRDEFYGRVIILSALSLLWGIRYKYYCAGDILLYNMGMEFATQVSKLHYSEIVSMFLSLIGVDIAYRNKMKKKYSCLIIAVLSFVVAVINFIR